MNPLESERLIIREFTETDKDQMISFASDERITKWLPDWLNCREWIEPWINMAIHHYRINKPMDNFLAYAVVEKSSNNIIGHIGIGDFEKNEMGICYVINPEYTNIGYATEAMKIFIDYIFNLYRCDYLIATIQPDNISSIRVAEKLGFKFIRSIEIIDNGQSEKLPFNYYQLQRTE